VLAATLAATVLMSGCGEEQSDAPPRAVVAKLCQQLAEDEDAEAKPESRAWCRKFYVDMSDAHIRELLRLFRGKAFRTVTSSASDEP
jgi:hypothetical protein